jgi:transglutaminase-like putative cysteine protease
MLLNITHQTAYDYATPVKTAQHMVHLKPRDDSLQQVLSHRLTVTPNPAQQNETTDVYGNTRTFFSLPKTHEQLTVRAESRVSTHPVAARQDGLPWEQVRERMRFHRDAEWDAATEFVFASPYVPRHPDFLEYARPCFTPERPVWQAAQALMTRIHGDFTFETDVTDIGTPALEALRMRKGVCQDFAHIMLGCLRSLGLPARYVSGYLLTQPPPGQPRLVGADASHAWISVYLPGADGGAGQWADLDPTNDRLPGEDYVRLATGRDYGDVSPIRGMIHGGAEHTLRVAVTVMPMPTGEAAGS